VNYEDFRREYTAQGLSADALSADPLQQFQQWMDQALKSDLTDPTAMVLATVDAAGEPWQRIVLCKGIDARGFSFFTNYESDKARAIAGNNAVSLLFPWNAIDRQVIVAGRVRKLEADEAGAYFATRPRDSQVAAWASEQSHPVSDRAALEARFAQLAEQFDGAQVPLPPFWGGFCVEPHRIEFWQGRESRLHDRFRYTRQAGGDWTVVRLQP
jgi:pyridoxamine 5'-phosphate oxidase